MGVLDELHLGVRHLEDTQLEMQKLRGQVRSLAGQLQTSQQLHELQLEEAWPLATDGLPVTSCEASFRFIYNTDIIHDHAYL